MSDFDINSICAADKNRNPASKGRKSGVMTFYPAFRLDTVICSCWHNVVNMVEETGESGENHRPWMGDHYPVTCFDSDLNPDRRYDKCVIHYAIQTPAILLTLHEVWFVFRYL